MPWMLLMNPAQNAPDASGIGWTPPGDRQGFDRSNAQALVIHDVVSALKVAVVNDRDCESGDRET
jgi:hypothetical protein